MKITATYQDKIIAQGEYGTEVVSVDGNYYFSREVTDFGHLQIKGKGQQYYCPIKKSKCDYYNLVDENENIIVDEIGWIYETTIELYKACAKKIAFYSDKVSITTK